MEQQTLNFETTVKAICPACGAKTDGGRWEILTPGLCEALRKFYAASLQTGRAELHLTNDCDFTQSEYNNFNKLKFFELVRKVHKRSGYWTLTYKGTRFVNNEIAVDRKVFVFRNEVRERSGELIRISDALDFEKYWLQKADYVSA